MRIIFEHACIHAAEMGEMTLRSAETWDFHLAPVAIWLVFIFWEPPSMVYQG